MFIFRFYSSKWRTFLTEWRGLLDENAPLPAKGLTKLHRFAHFWFLVGRSFSRNRCPVRASALAYASLLALIPMLAVVVSVTSSFLKSDGEQKIDELIVRLVDSLTPSASLHPKHDHEQGDPNAPAPDAAKTSLAEAASTNQSALTVESTAGTNAAAKPGTDWVAESGVKSEYHARAKVSWRLPFTASR